MHADPNKPKKRGDRALKLVPTDEQEVALHISLSDIEPVIWRRIQVSDAIDLHELHLAIQGAFGWQNNHLHSFIVKQGEAYTSRPSVFDFNADDETMDSRSIHLRDLIERQIKGFRYVYDLGDNWLHKIRIESVQPKTREVLSPICVDGGRHSPPEDCGGSLGYEELLENTSLPFDPEAFNLREANACMKKMLNGQKP